MKHWFALCVFVLFLGNHLFSRDTTVVTAAVAQAYSCIYNFRPASADSLVTELKKKYPDEKKVYLLSANANWWKIRSGEDNVTNRKQFLSDLRAAEAILGKKKKEQLSSEDLFQYIHVYSYMARLELLDSRYFRAFSYIDKCSEYLFTSFGRELMYEPLFLTTGLYHYCIAAARKKYPLLIPFLAVLPGTDKEEGLKCLRRCCESTDEILKTEGRYFLMTVYGESDIDYALSAGYASRLCGQYPKNLLYRYYLYSILLQDEKKDKAMEEYKLLYQASRSGKELSPLQQEYFLALAKKDLMEYYRKHPKEAIN